MELSAQEPRELERMRRISKALAPESEKPDRLRDFRGQRLNRPDGTYCMCDAARIINPNPATATSHAVVKRQTRYGRIVTAAMLPDLGLPHGRARPRAVSKSEYPD